MENSSTIDQQTTMTACPECDLLLKFSLAKPRHAVHCPRCKYRLHEHKPNSLNNTLAIAITGLLLFIPATTLPIMSMTLFGILTVDTVFDGILMLYEAGYQGVSILIMLCSMLFPLLRLVLAVLVLIPIKLQRATATQIKMFKLFHHLDSWTMLEVYMVGILVAIIKMIDIASVQPGIGMLCFIGLMFSSIGVGLTLDEHETWILLEEQAHA